MKTSKLLTITLTILTAVVLLTSAIAVPILCRPFYYAHIGPLELCEQTGLTRKEIKTAFDEMMDFCVKNEKFSTGALRWSESGNAHFADVRSLFLLDLRTLAGSVFLLTFILIVSQSAGRRPDKLLGRGPTFWAGTGLACVFAIIGAFAVTDFDRTFTIFHIIFFPGKGNWLFDPAEDQIITILPQEFFRNCAILILGLILLGCAVLIVWDLLPHRKNPRSTSTLDP